MTTADGLLAIAKHIVDKAEKRLRSLRQRGAADHRVEEHINRISAYQGRLGRYSPFDGTDYLCPKCSIEQDARTIIRNAGASDKTLWRCEAGHNFSVVDPEP